jgi:transposase
MSIATVGIDLAKNVFHVHGVDAEGCTRRKTSRAGFERLMAEVPVAGLGWNLGRVRIIGPVGFRRWGMTSSGCHCAMCAPYVKTNKHDAADAQACCKAVQRPAMRFVPVKTIEQQAVLVLPKVRNHLVCQ